MKNELGPIEQQVTINNDRVFFKVGSQYKPVNCKDISYFFAEARVIYGRVNNRNLATYVQLKSLETLLYPIFLRCHKKYIVNISQVEAILLKDSKVKINGTFIPIGQAYRKAFLQNLCLLK